MNVSTQNINFFLKMILKYMKNYKKFHTITQETYTISKHYNKIYEKVYKTIEIFHNMTHKT